jgi:hypothetical protein
MFGDAAYRASSNARHGTQQMPGLRIAVQAAGDRSHTLRKLRSDSRDRFRDPRESFLGQGKNGLGDDRKQLAGSHSNQRQKVLGRLLLGLRFGSQFPEMFHHGIRIDFADGANLVLELALELPFEFALELTLPFKLTLAFAEEAADHIADGAQPALALYLALELAFTFEFAFELGFQFKLGLICHDDSSSLSCGDLL